MQRRQPADAFAQVLEGVVLLHGLVVRDALGGSFYRVTGGVLPEAEPRAAVELVHREEPVPVLRPDKHCHLVHKVLVNLQP